MNADSSVTQTFFTWGTRSANLYLYMDPNREGVRLKRFWCVWTSNPMYRFGAGWRRIRILEKNIPSSAGSKIRAECLPVQHMWALWFLPHQFISLHCNPKQHIWNHLKVFFIPFQLLIRKELHSKNNILTGLLLTFTWCTPEQIFNFNLTFFTKTSNIAPKNILNNWTTY